MQIIINFFEYTLSGWLYVIYFILMMIFAFACLGVVGEKVSKKKQAELQARRERVAQEEYKKAQETLDKQAHSFAVDNTLDPTIKKEDKANVETSVTTSTENVVQEQPKVPDVIVLDAPSESNDNVVDNITPIVDNTNEESVKTDVPSVLVINEDGTSNASS